MSPEMVKKRTRKEKFSYDPFKSDIWSFGVTIYLMLTNWLPFDNSTWETYLAQLRDPSQSFIPLPEEVDPIW